jgi:CDP-4-dehydro-6-deoxyglucose reductase, E3
MVKIEYEGRSYAIADKESVLDALLRNGLPVAHSCKAGGCGSCLMRAVEGTVPAKAQAGLKDSWKEQGYFLACVCHPESNLCVGGVGADARLGASITALDLLSSDVMRVRLRSDESIRFRAGQYVTVILEGGLSRSYSVASLPNEGELELHVRRISGGRMSGWFHDDAELGERVSILGPSGECFYVPGREDQPLLLIGTGTGLAPLYGILRDALLHGHRGPVHLFHGALHKGGLYLVDELRRLAGRHSHVEYTPAVLRGDHADGFEVGPIDQVVLQKFPKLTGWRAFVCGDPALVQSLKKKLFISGMASRDIYSDAFLPSAPSSQG